VMASTWPWWALVHAFKRSRRSTTAAHRIASRTAGDEQPRSPVHWSRPWGSITNFFATPESNWAYPLGASSSEITSTPTTCAIRIRSQRIACIKARLYLITGVCPVKKLCDLAQPRPRRTLSEPRLATTHHVLVRTTDVGGDHLQDHAMVQRTAPRVHQHGKVDRLDFNNALLDVGNATIRAHVGIPWMQNSVDGRPGKTSTVSSPDSCRTITLAIPCFIDRGRGARSCCASSKV
jgi:hypothetical protein